MLKLTTQYGFHELFLNLKAHYIDLQMELALLDFSECIETVP